MMEHVKKRLVWLLVIAGGALALVWLIAGVAGCHPSLLTVKWPEGSTLPGAPVPTPTGGIDGTIAGLLGAAAVAYPALIRPIRLWFANRKDAKP